MLNIPVRTFHAITLVLIGVMLGSCVTQPQHQPGKITKSNSDDRSYHSFILANQLKVLVISDPEADKAAASLDVHIGSAANPENRPGLAHFLEHMLFLGTEKYPETGDYQRYISEHGGSHNAFTAYENTNYFFDIDTEFLAPALDRFAQFFIAPLFNAELIEREKHAVDSEYQSNLKDDWRRQYAVLKQAANPAHPFSRFFVGNLETLADRPGQPIRDELLTFYQRYYSANLMTLVVLGNEPVTALEALVREKFSDVPNHAATPPATEAPMFNPEQLPASLVVKPEKDISRLSILFPIPAPQPYYRSKPTEYLANLLGHEGQGSLLAYLKQQGWAEQLSAGVSHQGSDAATFQITISLTESGLTARHAIVAALFAKINEIAAQGINQWRFDEQRRLAQIEFDFKERETGVRYVMRLAGRLHHYPAQQVLQAPYLMDQFRPSVIRAFLARLTPDNMVMLTVAQGFKTDQVTRWFNAPYRIEKISPQWQGTWQDPPANPALQLPEPNPFIPEDLRIKTDLASSNEPRPLEINKGLTLWYSPDIRFNTPRADFYFSIRSPVANNSPANHLLTRLYTRFVNDQLNEFSYPAYLAGLNYRLYPHVRGISVRISGYSDKQSVLLQKIIETLKKPQLSEQKFAIFKDEIARQLENVQRDKPSRQALDWLSKLLLTSAWEEARLETALATLTLEDLQQFIANYLGAVEMVALANGNLYQEEAVGMAQRIAQTLLPDAEIVTVPHQPIIQLPQEQPVLYAFNVDHPDSALVEYLQAEDKSYHSQARFALFSQLLSAPFYQELRTFQQRGYIVFATPVNLMDVPATALVIQSPNTPADELAQHVQTFLETFKQQVQAMTKEEFDRHKNALLTRLMEKETRLSQRSARLWQEIDRENYDFDRREKLAAAIRNYPLAQLQRDYRDYLLGDRQRQLTIMANGERFPIARDSLNGYRVISKRADLPASYF